MGMQAISGPFAYLLLSAVLACCGGSGNSSSGAPSSDGGSASADGGPPGDGSLPGEAGGPEGAADTGLDPALPTPSHDCRTDTSANCISIAGTYKGVPIDVFCNATNDLTIIVHAGKWVVGCDHLNSGFARLYIPVQKPGSFAEMAAAGSKPQMEFEFSADASNTSVALFSSNLVRAELGGTIVVVSAPYRSVSGTFHGDWATPGASCYGLSGTPCAAADINVTYRIETSNGSCFNNGDCTAPKTCDLVAYDCY